MKKITKYVAATAFSLSAFTVTAQHNLSELLEQLELSHNTLLSELTVHQFVQINNFQPLNTPICTDFSSLNLWQNFAAGYGLLINGLTFTSHYNGGSRVSPWDTYPGDKFLEMVEDGHLIIDLPLVASQISLTLIQAGNHPIEIEYFDNGLLVGTATSTIKDTLETIDFSDHNVNEVILSYPELLMYKVCYQ